MSDKKVPLGERPQGDNSAVRRGQSILTVDQLQRLYLKGIPLTDQFGNTLDEEDLQSYIDIAISMLETYLDINIVPTTICEEKDYQSNDYWQWGYFQMNNIPIQSVSKLEAVYPNAAILSYPTDWCKIQNHDGIIRIIPNAGTSAQFSVDAGGQYFPEIFRNQGHVPLVWQVTYIAGFCDGHVPMDVNATIGMLAAVMALNNLGGHVLPPGLAGSSLSLDGLSESLQTTMTATTHAYSGLTKAYGDALYGDPANPNNPGMLKRLLDYWQGGVRINVI